MTIKPKKLNLKRQASLSALGAGALGVNAGTAEAYVVYSGIVKQKVGFGSGYGTHASIALPNGAGLAFRVFRSTFPNTPGTILFLNVIAQNLGGPNGTGASFGVVNTGYTTLALADPQGAKFGTPPVVRSDGWIATSEGGYQRIGHTYTKFNSTDRYLMFRFTGGKLPYPIYGWAQLSVTLPGHSAGPQVTLVSWAYETSGAQLPAGVHGKALDGSDDISEIAPSAFGATEPSALALTGLPALALGAQGLHRWRAARKAA
jgi:hypothetical protein